MLALGLLSCHFAAPAFAEPDPRHFVIDEFIGFYCSVLLLPWDWKTVVAAFVLFRLFDITKPFPARPLDKKLPGAFGVVVDDVVAGIYANLGVRLVRMWI